MNERLERKQRAYESAYQRHHEATIAATEAVEVSDQASAELHLAERDFDREYENVKAEARLRAKGEIA